MRKATFARFTLAAAASITFGLSSLAWANAATIAKEAFCYPASNPPVNGGTGWAGGWTASGAVVHNGGLQPYPGGGYPTISCPSTLPNNSLGSTPGSAASRALGSAVTPGPSSGVILRALIQSNVPGTPATQATLGNSAGGTLTIGDLPVSDPNGGNWGMQLNGGATYFSTVPVAQGVTTALTVEVDFGASLTSPGQDRIRLWVQTTGAYSTAGSPDLDESAPAMSAFSGVFWQTQGLGALVDEIEVDQLPPLPATLDHFKCYVPGSSILASGGTTSLLDEFDTNFHNGTPESVTVGKLYRFCNPVVKTYKGQVTPVTHPGLHLAFYAIQTTTQGTYHLKVKNQFGKQKLQIGPPEWLGVPTSVSPLPPPPPGTLLSHFKCYPVTNVTVDLTDPFFNPPHMEQGVVIGSPVVFCNAAKKVHAVNGAVVTYPAVNPSQHLLCYQFAFNAFTFQLKFNNQYNNDAGFTATGGDILCVPSTLTKVTTP